MQSNKFIEKDDDTSLGTGLKAPKIWVYGIELGLAAVAISMVIVWAIWPFLSAANDTYPDTVDAMGHLTRIKYIADSFTSWKWPAWFPYQDNGSIAMQYFPPLSYVLLAFVQMLTNNVMITFKITVFLAQFIGGLGVWCICRRFIGSWVGIVGGILYAIQPFLLMALLNVGEVLQIPVYAITPWLLYFSFLFFEKISPLRWLLVCISGTLLILSHAMSAFLICIGIGVIILVLLIRRDISIKVALLWVIAMGLAAGLEAFWAIPSLTTLENPLVPSTLPDSAVEGAAVTSLFNPALSHGLYYAGYAVFLLALGSIIQVRKNKLILPLAIAVLISICISFGTNFPLYEYIPLSANFLPRKFLSFSVMAAIILDVFFLKEIFSRYRSSNYLGKAIALMLITCMAVMLVVDINPRMMIIHHPDSFTGIRQGLDQISVTTKPFEQGRLAPLFAFPSWYFYFAMTEGLNLTHGNISSSSYINTHVQHNIAIVSECPDYIVKNLLNWNTRFVYFNGEYAQLRDDLIQHGFQVKDVQRNILINPTPSSYVMRQERNAIAIGLAAPPLVITFPWLIQGESASLEDYSPQDLDSYKLIYLIEPDVKDFEKFQKMVIDLLDSGKTVIVSMGNSKVWPLAGIIPYWETIPSASNLIPTESSPIKQSISMDPDPFGQAPAMGNLDEVWMEMQAENKRVPTIGYKNVNGHRLYFVGLNLDKQLNAATRWARGYQADVGHSKEVAAIIEQIMDIGQPNKNIVPAAFPVSDAVWGKDSFSFKYKSDQPVSVMVSVTYSMHWNGKLDSSPLKVEQIEKLILLNLPAGEHHVSMYYGMTWVGWLGIILSIFSLLIVIFIYRRFEDLDRFFAFMNMQIKRMVEGVGA